ncbi:MAG: putative metalloprotease CJM1_0395 family protein [Candidatus Thiodiazotropha endolucinida]
MTISLGMLSGLGNTASAVEWTVPGSQSAGPDKNASGGASADSAAIPATRDSTTQRPVRESGESSQLTQEEQAEVRELQKRDREVRAHEAAHRAAAGGLASGGSYTYKRGPDGRSYAVGGEVSIRIPSTDDPRERARQAETVRRAALAPADPSPQDRQVAAQASAMAAQARSEIQAEQRQQLAENREKATERDGDGGAANTQKTFLGQRAIASFQSVGSVANLHSNPSTIDEMI